MGGQIPPLGFPSVGMTRGRLRLGLVDRRGQLPNSDIWGQITPSVQVGPIMGGVDAGRWSEADVRLWRARYSMLAEVANCRTDRLA
ncbi:MAG: hypothetical protein ACYS9C_02340 [Planctomycetota bacterium]